MLYEIGHELHDVTPTMDARAGGSVISSAVKRCEEIAGWLDDHPEVTRFVILDDDWDAGALPELKPSFIQTDSFVGLTPETAARCVEFLSKPND